MARGFTQPLGNNTANAGLKELLKTAAVTQKRDRVVVTAVLPPDLLAALSHEAEPAQSPAPPKQ
jgi:hypothetical protein